MFFDIFNCWRKKPFSISKPKNWTKLPLYKKIKYVGGILTEEYAPYVDKISAKNIVKSICGDNIKIPEIVRILDGPDDLQESDMDEAYLIKASHGSGWLIDPQIHNSIVANKLLLHCWNKPFINTKNNQVKIEKQYSFLKPRFFIEKKIECAYSGLGGNALDVKVNCFYGKPKFVLVQKDKKKNFYSLDWKPLMALEFPFEIPACMDDILKLSKILSEPFEFVRVDFYIGVDGIYFSEFTFTPKAGNRRLTEELEFEYGKYW